MDIDAIAEAGRKFKVERFFLNAIRFILSALALTPIIVYAVYLFSWRGDDQMLLASYLMRNGWYVLFSVVALVAVNLIMNAITRHARITFGRSAYTLTPWYQQTHLDQTTTGCVHYFNNRGELCYRQDGDGELFSTMHFANRLYAHCAIQNDVFVHVLVPCANGSIAHSFLPVVQVSAYGVAVFDLKPWRGDITLFDRGGCWFAQSQDGTVYPAFMNDDEIAASVRALADGIRESDIHVYNVLMDATSLSISDKLPPNRRIFMSADLEFRLRRIGTMRLDEDATDALKCTLETFRYPSEEEFQAYLKEHDVKEESYRRLITAKLEQHDRR